MPIPAASDSFSNQIRSYEDAASAQQKISSNTSSISSNAASSGEIRGNTSVRWVFGSGVVRTLAKLSDPTEQIERIIKATDSVKLGHAAQTQNVVDANAEPLLSFSKQDEHEGMERGGGA